MSTFKSKPHLKLVSKRDPMRIPDHKTRLTLREVDLNLASQTGRTAFFKGYKMPQEYNVDPGLVQAFEQGYAIQKESYTMQQYYLHRNK